MTSRSGSRYGAQGARIGDSVNVDSWGSAYHQSASTSSQFYFPGRSCRNSTRLSPGYNLGLYLMAGNMHANVLPGHLLVLSTEYFMRRNFNLHASTGQLNLAFHAASFVLYLERHSIKDAYALSAVNWLCTADGTSEERFGISGFLMVILSLRLGWLCARAGKCLESWKRHVA